MPLISRMKAIALLNQCTGGDIWSLEACRNAGIPDAWIDELSDCYESGFRSERDTIYYEGDMVNQYEGIHDLLLARKCATLLGIDVQRIASVQLTRESEVRALREAVDEI